MGFIILTSDNQNLSYCIKKNPITSPHTRLLRKGICIGWYHSELRYVVKFMDMTESVSFPKNHKDTYDYLPYMQYCAPIIMTCVVKDMFGTLVNQGSVEDKTGICSLEQGVMKLSDKAVKLIVKLNMFINKYRIDLRPTNVARMYGFTVSSENSTMSELLQYVYMLGYILNCITFKYVEKLDNLALDKIIRIMNSLSVPYYIRYVFKNYMLGRKEFTRVKKDLEGPDGLNISMVYGNTQCQRCDFISEHVMNFCADSNKQIHLVDVGCGGGYYVRNLLKLLKDRQVQNVTYYAHDIDEKEMDKIDTLVGTDPMYSVVKPYRSVDEMISSLNTGDNEIMIVFSEVIEHIPLETVKQFMIKIISEIRFKKMVITTPSVEFNVHYLLAKNEFRHPDHKQEFTKQEFITFIDEVLDNIEIGSRPTYCYMPIGDCVNGVGMSQGIILSGPE